MKGSRAAAVITITSASILLTSSTARAAQDPCLSLGTPILTNSQFLLPLTGESGVTYYIESSTDLQSWMRILTNSDPSFDRVVMTDVPSQTTFYRASRDRLPLFAAAITTSQNIDFKGNNVAMDSYDSSDPNHSTNGMYNAATRKAGGDVFSSGALVNVGNAVIYGRLRLAPGSSYSLGPYGSVGDLTWTGPGVEPGWAMNDFKFCLPQATPPFSAGQALPAPGSGTINLTSTNYYSSTNYTMRSGDFWIVDGGNPVLYIAGSFRMGSISAIVITNGGTLTLHVGSSSGLPTSCFLTQVLTSGPVSSFHLYTLPTTTSLAWGGNTNFVGTVYAPQANFSLGGGGAATLDYQGAVVVQSIIINGDFNFHFDEYLRRSALTR